MQKSWGLNEIVEQLSSCGYECEAGPLENNAAFQQLSALAAHNGAAIPQPLPIAGRIDVADIVIEDINERVQAGLEKYGTKLQTFNGRDARWDLYQELIDAVMYLRQDLLERPSPPIAGDDRYYLKLIADELDRAPRQGKYVDDPEGSRYVIISETALMQIVAHLRGIAGEGAA